MKKNFWMCLCFVACFAIGFVCGMFVQSRIANNRAAQDGGTASSESVKTSGIKCLDGTMPDSHGCCTGEEYTYVIDSDMWACCPAGDGDCFPPIPMGE